MPAALFVIFLTLRSSNAIKSYPLTISVVRLDDANPLRLITIGVGIDNYNDFLLEQLAQHGNGWYRYLDDVASARRTFHRDNWLALSIPFADQTRAQVRWDPDVVERWRILGYENRVTSEERFAEDRKEFAEIPSCATITAFYEIELTDEAGDVTGGVSLGNVEARWVSPKSRESMSVEAAIMARSVDDMKDREYALLRLGALVGLAADRYGSPALMEGRRIKHSVRDALGLIEDDLDELEAELGGLGAYKDFAFLLGHMALNAPERGDDVDSGYSR